VRLVVPVSLTMIDSTPMTLGQTGPVSGGFGTVSGTEPVTDSDPLRTYIPVPWDVGSASLSLPAFNTRLSDQPPGLDPDSTQDPSVQGEQGKKNPPKWQKNDLVSGGHGQAGSWRGQ